MHYIDVGEVSSVQTFPRPAARQGVFSSLRHQCSRTSFVGCKSTNIFFQNSELNEMIDKWPKFIRTNDLEDNLLQLAKKLGICFKFVEVDRFDDLLRDYPSAGIVVGSDGSHSVVRKNVFHNDLSVMDDLQLTVEVKYEVSGVAEPLDPVTEAYPCLKLMHYVATESIGKPKDGKTPVTLRLLVDSEAHAAVKEASFKNPFYFPTHESQFVFENNRCSACRSFLNFSEGCTRGYGKR